MLTIMIRPNQNIDRWQTISSLVILTLLLTVGAGIIYVQSRFNPAVLQPETRFVEAPEKSAAALPEVAPFFTPLPQELTPLSAAETFDARTLSDKIDGKAELYFSAGFKSLSSQRFKDAAGGSDRWFEAYVYDMDNNRNAFSVFSSQRREDAVALDLTAQAYRTPNALFFVNGGYYVEIIASEASDHVLQPMKLLAETFIRNTPAETAAIDEMKLFPRQGLVADSISLISSDAFGHADLDKVYTAEYEQDGARLMGYISRRQSPTEAEKLAGAYREFLITYGGRTVESRLSIPGAAMVEILDSYEIIFYHGVFLAGVREAATIDQAKELAERLYNRIKEANDDS